MPYGSGTITSATPWQQLSTNIQAQFGLTGSQNWSFIETIPAGTSTGQSGSANYKIDVFKCAGSGTNANDAATDFYVAFRIPVPDGAVASTVYVFEDYEGGTNKRFRRPVASSTSTAGTGAGYWRTDTYAAAASVTGVQAYNFTALNTSGFTYQVRVAKNNLCVTTRVGSTDQFFIVGLGDTFIPSSLATDVLLCAGNAGSLQTSREPAITDATISKWSYNGYGWTAALGSNAVHANDFWQGNQVITPRMALTRSFAVNDTASAYLVGGLRGLIKDVLLMGSGGTVNVGDTMAIGGVTYFVYAKDAYSVGAPALGSTATAHGLLPQT